MFDSTDVVERIKSRVEKNLAHCPLPKFASAAEGGGIMGTDWGRMSREDLVSHRGESVGRVIWNPNVVSIMPRWCWLRRLTNAISGMELGSTPKDWGRLFSTPES